MSKPRLLGAETAVFLTRWCSLLILVVGQFSLVLSIFLSNCIWKAVLKCLCWHACLLMGWGVWRYRLSVLVLLCLAWQTVWQPSSWLMSKGHILCLRWKRSWSERKRAALTSKVGVLVKSQSMLEGSRRGELFPTQIPKADGAWGLSVLKRNAICIDLKSFEWLQRAIGCELRAAGWWGWPCCCCMALHCKSLHLFLTGC